MKDWEKEYAKLTDPTFVDEEAVNERVKDAKEEGHEAAMWAQPMFTVCVRGESVRREVDPVIEVDRPEDLTD